MEEIIRRIIEAGITGFAGDQVMERTGLGKRASGILDDAGQYLSDIGNAIVPPAAASDASTIPQNVPPVSPVPDVVNNEGAGANILPIQSGRSAPPQIQQHSPTRLPDIQMGQTPEERAAVTQQFVRDNTVPDGNVQAGNSFFNVDPETLASLDRRKVEAMDVDEARKIIRAGDFVFNKLPKVDEVVDKTGDESLFEAMGSRIKSYFGDEENMTRLALAFNSMRLEPDQGLASVLGKRLETLGTQRKDNKTIAMLLKDGSPEAIRAANYIRMGGDAKTALTNFRKAGTVKVMTGAQLKSEYGIEVPDPTALYNYDTVTGKLSGVGGPSKTILQMGNEALTGAIYKDIGDQRTAFIEEGKSSRGRLDAYNRIGNLLRTTDQGRFAETKQDVRKILDTIGLGNAIDVDQYQNATSLQAATNQLVAEELRANKGPQTDFDARFSQSYIPNIQNPAEANKAMVKFGQSKAEGQSVFGRIANKIRSTDPDVENKMAALNEMALTFNNVIFAPNGTPLYFIDWANANRGEDPMTIMSQWVEKVKQNQMGQ